jgi:threonine dehydratase
MERAKLVVEPAGVVAVAALMERCVDVEPPVAVVLSGGNVDPLVLLRVLRHGLAASGRYLAVRVRVADHPGALAALLEAVAESDANVVDVEHVRTEPTLQVDEVEIAVQLETRGAEHCDAVVDHLRDRGYRVTARSDQ